VNIYTRETNRQSYLLPRLRVILARLSGWLGLDIISKLPWSARLPCVFGASLLLVLLISGIGVPTKDIYSILILTLLGVPVALIWKRSG